jgi:hypothetical protein
MNKDLFLAILSLDSYNRGYAQGVRLNETDKLIGQNEIGRTIGNASIIKQSDFEAGRDGVNAGFYALAYDVSNVTNSAGSKLFGITDTVIAYRGSDYEDTGGLSPFSNDILKGWAVGAGFADASQAQLALSFYSAVTQQSPYNRVTVTVAITPKLIYFDD